MKSLNFLTTLTVCLLTGCGVDTGTEASSGSASSSSIPVNTNDIVAERDFLFQLDRKIKLDINQTSNDHGVVHVYTKMDALLDDGRYIADPTSHLTSIYPKDSPSTDLIVNVNWPALYLQWTPMGVGTELTWRIDLSTGESNYLLQF